MRAGMDTFRRGAFGVAMILSLSGCLPDTEEGLREEVGAWLSLGDTLYFHATRTCTAGVFEARSGVFHSAVRSVTSWPEAQRHIEQNRAVVFETLTGSPSDFTGAIMGQQPHIGTQFLSAGLAGRNCMDAEVEAAYHVALNEVGAILLFDPASQTLGVLQPERRRIFITRGEL